MTQRVGDYFRKTGKDPKNPGPMLLRMIPLLAFTFLMYGLSFSLPSFVSAVVPARFAWFEEVLTSKAGWMVAAILYGTAQALCLMHVMHDASHAAVGRTETWWKVGTRGILDWLAGASIISWHHQHIVGHHVYTNVFGADPDLPLVKDGDLRRLVKKQSWAGVYRYQQWYLPVLYGALAIKFRVQDVVNTWLEGYNGPVRVNMYANPYLRIALIKVIWVGWRILLPMYAFNVAASQVWTAWLLAELATGYYLAFNFQVSHISDTVAWPNGGGAADPGTEGNLSFAAGPLSGPGSAPIPASINDSWAVAQVKTSVGYGHHSRVTDFLTGALNYQVEHHLFPGITQYHYPAIAPIVKETCKEFGIPYRYETGFWSAFAAHWRHLRDMGIKGKPVSMDE